MAYRPNYESADYKAGFEDGEYAAKTAQALARAKDRNFCERCGKRRGGDANYIHTCTPPQSPSFPVPKSFRESVCQQMGIPMTPRMFDDNGNRIK